MCLYHGAPVGVWGQLSEVISFFLTYRIHESNWSHQAWQPMPLPAKPSLRPWKTPPFLDFYEGFQKYRRDLISFTSDTDCLEHGVKPRVSLQKHWATLSGNQCISTLTSQGKQARVPGESPQPPMTVIWVAMWALGPLQVHSPSVSTIPMTVCHVSKVYPLSQ